MSEQANDSGPSSPMPASPVPGAIPASIAAGVGALACFLPWYNFQLASFDSALDTAVTNAFGASVPGGSFPGFGDEVSGIFGGLSELVGTVSVTGIDMWPGMVALLALAAAAIMHLLELSQGNEKSRSNLLVGSVILSAVGGACAIYGLSQIGGPVGVHVGLVMTLLGGLGATVLSVKRLQAFGPWRQSSLLVG